MRISQGGVRLAIGVLIAAAVLMVLAMRWLPTFGSWAPVAGGTLAYAIGWYVILLVAFALVPIRLGAGGNYIPLTGQFANALVAAMAIIAAAGAGLLIYEFAVVRGFGFDTSVLEIRVKALQDAQAGFVGSWNGGIGRLLAAALPVGWVLMCTRWRDIKWLTIFLLLLSTALVQFEQMKFEGGRFALTALVITALVATLATVAANAARDGVLTLKSFRPVFQPLALLVILVLAVGYYNARVFAERGEYTIDEITTSAIGVPSNTQEASPYARAYTAHAADRDLDFTSMDLQNFGPRDYIAAMTWLYVTQGLNEFDAIFTFEQHQPAWGAYQFPQIAQLLSKLTGQDLRYDLAANLPRVGTYVALPGAAFVDFGSLFGMVFAAILGLMLRVGTDAILSGHNSAYTLIAPFVLVAVLFGPIVSILPILWPCFAWIGLIWIASSFFAKERTNQADGERKWS